LKVGSAGGPASFSKKDGLSVGNGDDRVVVLECGGGSLAGVCDTLPVWKGVDEELVASVDNCLIVELVIHVSGTDGYVRGQFVSEQRADRVDEIGELGCGQILSVKGF